MLVAWDDGMLATVPHCVLWEQEGETAAAQQPADDGGAKPKKGRGGGRGSRGGRGGAGGRGLARGAAYVFCPREPVA